MVNSLDPRHARIVVRGLNWLGDTVMATPALLRLREALPQAHITMLAPAKLADLWPGHPAVNEVLPFDPKGGIFSLARQIRSAGFDAGLIFPNSFRSAFELWLGRVRRRIGYSNNGRSWMLTDPQPYPSAIRKMHKRSPEEVRRLLANPEPHPAYSLESHHAFAYLRLVEKLGANPAALPPSLQVSRTEQEKIRQRFPVAAPLLCGLNPGAEYGPSKRWPPELFVEAAAQLTQAHGCHWWIFGGHGDAALAQRIVDELEKRAPGSSQNLAGKTTLRELMAAITQTKALLTNDTGPMHLAAALGVPVVALFGSTSPELTAPGLPGRFPGALIRNPPPCAPCFLRECPIDHRCMRSISVKQVIEGAMPFLHAPRSDF